MFKFLDGYKSYIAGIGLLGLAVYQLSVGHFEMAIETFLAAIAVFGVRHAISKGK